MADLPEPAAGIDAGSHADRPGNPLNVALDPTRKFLYVVHNQNVQQANRPGQDIGTDIHVVNVNADGTLTETITPVILTVPMGETRVGIATLLN